MLIFGSIVCASLAYELQRANNDLLKALMATLPLLMILLLEDPMFALGGAATEIYYYIVNPPTLFLRTTSYFAAVETRLTEQQERMNALNSLF
ncbi:Hypothetical predicted protein [Cloeon dipterum]|uniref:Uncharacterized protein n=1 Tax=Cloeon dipterum TaxID=197152 RepID=A0A8S1DJ87_9INSE|nr:Hypothetical predicted protein [Cloeon dipterum]